MPNRALRRHSIGAKTDKSAKGGAARPNLGLAPARPTAKKEGGSGLASWRPHFLMDIITELRKVVWPSRQDTVHLTIVVVVVAIIMGAVLGALDVGFGWLIDRTILR